MLACGRAGRCALSLPLGFPWRKITVPKSPLERKITRKLVVWSAATVWKTLKSVPWAGSLLQLSVDCCITVMMSAFTKHPDYVKLKSCIVLIHLTLQSTSDGINAVHTTSQTEIYLKETEWKFFSFYFHCVEPTGGVIWFKKHSESSCGANKLSKGISLPVVISHPHQPQVQIASTLRTGPMPSVHPFAFSETPTCSALEGPVL